MNQKHFVDEATFKKYDKYFDSACAALQRSLLLVDELLETLPAEDVLREKCLKNRALLKDAQRLYDTLEYSLTWKGQKS